MVPLSRSPGHNRGADYVVVPDYLDLAHLRDAFAGAAVVVHLAARAHQHDGADAASAYDLANVRGARAVAEACRVAGVRRMVFLSSIGVNGNRTCSRPFSEADVPAPVEEYARSKLEAERSVVECLGGGPTDFVILRPPLVYGAGCPGNFRLLLRLVHRLPVVPLGGLHQQRSLIHVDNLCDAIVHAALHPGAAGRTFLLSDGADLNVAQIAQELCRGFGKPLSRVWALPEPLLRLLATAAGKRRAFDKLAAALAVDISAFIAATGWQPPLTPAQGLEQTARQYLIEQQS